MELKEAIEVFYAEECLPFVFLQDHSGYQNGLGEWGPTTDRDELIQMRDSDGSGGQQALTGFMNTLEVELTEPDN